MSSVNERECGEAGLDVAAVRKLARRISKAAVEAERMGLMVFGGSGTGTLRFNDKKKNEFGIEIGDLIVATLDGLIDGGAGDEKTWGDDFTRGE